MGRNKSDFDENEIHLWIDMDMIRGTLRYWLQFNKIIFGYNFNYAPIITLEYITTFK